MKNFKAIFANALLLTSLLTLTSCMLFPDDNFTIEGGKKKYVINVKGKIKLKRMVDDQAVLGTPGPEDTSAKITVFFNEKHEDEDEILDEYSQTFDKIIDVDDKGVIEDFELYLTTRNDFTYESGMDNSNKLIISTIKKVEVHIIHHSKASNKNYEKKFIVGGEEAEDYVWSVLHKLSFNIFERLEGEDSKNKIPFFTLKFPFYSCSSCPLEDESRMVKINFQEDIVLEKVD